MNVLLFVMSMLMVFSILTYGRLESYRNFASVQREFLHYMKEKEREFANEEAIRIYNERHATKKEEEESSKIANSSASTKLSFNLFIDKDNRDSNSEALENHINAATRLMDYLYKDQPFYKEMEEKRPNFLREIFSQLMSQTEEISFEGRLGNPKEIATVDLNDFELNEVFTKMLKGTVEKGEEVKVFDEDIFEEGEQKEAGSIFLPKDGYYPLLEFITLKKDKLIIRVYLASSQLLMVLFGYDDVVRNILDVRYNLYKELLQEKDKTAAEEEFKNLFLNQKLPFVPDTMLDFSLSKTNPKKYE